MENDPICPTCGRTMEDGCLPSSCPQWRTEAVWDRTTRTWLPVDDDGYTLTGERVGP